MRIGYRRGRSHVSVVREHYLREDISCKSELCILCPELAGKQSELAVGGAVAERDGACTDLLGCLFPLIKLPSLSSSSSSFFSSPISSLSYTLYVLLLIFLPPPPPPPPSLSPPPPSLSPAVFHCHTLCPTRRAVPEEVSGGVATPGSH